MEAEEADVSLKSILKSKRLKSGPLALSIIEILITYQLYKPYEDVTTIQLKPKKKRNGVASAQLEGSVNAESAVYFITVITIFQ